MKNILLIEDNPDILSNTAEILSLANYNVYTATDGKAGIELAVRVKPDLILCDIMMPALDGFGVFHQLNKNLYTAGTPFIFLTAKTEIIDKLKGIDIGADDYITKPFDDKILLSTIEARIRKNEIAQEKIQQERLSYIKELENMLQMTSHRVRKPVCSLLGLMQIIEQEHTGDTEMGKTIMNGFKESILELDAFTKELTDFIYTVRENNRSKI